MAAMPKSETAARPAAPPRARVRGTTGFAFAAALMVAAGAHALAQAQAEEPAATGGVTPGRKLPFLGDLARDRGIELPLPFGAGAVPTTSSATSP